MSIDTQVAEQFGQAVARADFEAAHLLLTADARREQSPTAMLRSVTRMLSYVEGEQIERVEVLHEFTLTDWPRKRSTDVAWVYIALEGPSFQEAASLVLAATAEGTRIRQVEWGRP